MKNAEVCCQADWLTQTLAVYNPSRRIGVIRFYSENATKTIPRQIAWGDELIIGYSVI